MSRIAAVQPSPFPSANGYIRATCAPLLFAPMLGSPEILVVGLVVVHQSEYRLQLANSLRKLDCLYGSAASSALFAVQSAESLLSARFDSAADYIQLQPEQIFSNVYLGDPWEGEGKSLQAICDNWLSSLSSFHDAPKQETSIKIFEDILEAVNSDQFSSRSTQDRLPTLVLDYVKDHGAEYVRYFNSIVRGDAKRKRGKSHEVFIHYSGPRLVANFGTLRANGITPSVNLIKKQLWDLKVDRDSVAHLGVSAREHELIVQRPKENDPQLTDRQLESVAIALKGLEAQADQEEIRLRPMSEVDAIGRHLVSAEAKGLVV